MYIRNLEPPTKEEHYNYEALVKYQKYPLPYAFKFVAWFFTIAGIIVSCTIMVLYGLSFGIIKTYLWFMGFFLSFILSLLVITPVRIIAFAILRIILMKSKPSTIRRRIHTSLLTNPENEEKKNQVLKFRQYNANLYKPTSLCKLLTRADDIKYNLELRNLTINVVLYFAFMLTAAFVVFFNRSTRTYYTNDVITEVFLKGNHTNSVSFMDVCTQEIGSQDHLDSPPQVCRYITTFRFSEYLKETLLPALLPAEDPNSCRELPKFEGRNLECAPELNLFNEERRDFSLQWRSPPPEGLTDSQASPWRYQSGLQTATIPIFAKFSSYHPGGYILELARNLDDAQIVLKYMDTFQWIDLRTRAAFIEFTLYCVSTNLFSVVTIIAEAPATGYIIPSYHIQTFQYLITTSETEFFSFIMLGIFSLTLAILILKESLKVCKMSLKFYVHSSSAYLDLSIILVGLISLLFNILRSIYASSLLRKLQEADNNVFVSFYYAALWSSLSTYIDAILVCIAPFKLFQLLTSRRNFFQIYYILSQCYNFFLNLYIQESILIIAFTLFFHMTLGKYSEGFSSFRNSLSTMIGRSAGLDDNFDFTVFLNYSFFLVPIIFILFFLLIPICFLNIFIAVVCLYFTKIRNTTFLDKYNLSEYIKSSLTSSNQKDILHLRDVNDLDEPAVMRLKGGGNVIARRKYCRIKKKTPKMIKVILKDFVTRKRCDMTKYLDLRKDRNLALRKMMLILTSEDENVAKDTFLLALYNSYITEKRKLYFQAGEYFFAEEHGRQEIHERGLFSRIKRVIEDLGRERNIIEEEDEICEEIDTCEAKLSLLERKMTFLLKKLGSE